MRFSEILVNEGACWKLQLCSLNLIQLRSGAVPAVLHPQTLPCSVLFSLQVRAVLGTEDVVSPDPQARISKRPRQTAFPKGLFPARQLSVLGPNSLPLAFHTPNSSHRKIKPFFFIIFFISTHICSLILEKQLQSNAEDKTGDGVQHLSATE